MGRVEWREPYGRSPSSIWAKPVLLLGAVYSAISICNLRDFSEVLEFLSTRFTKSTPRSIAMFLDHARSERWPYNSGVPKRMHFYKPKLAPNSKSKMGYASPCIYFRPVAGTKWSLGVELA